MTAIAARSLCCEGIAAGRRHVREQGRDPIWGHPALTEPVPDSGRVGRACARSGKARRCARCSPTTPTPAWPEFPNRDRSTSTPTTATATKGTDSLRARTLELTFEGVAAGPRVVALERTVGEDADGAIRRLLDPAEVDYVNVRNTEAGCFVARVDRRS